MPLDSAPTRTAVWLLGRAVDASWVTVSPQERGTTRSPWIFPETLSVLLSVPWLLILPLTPGFSFFRLQRLTVTTGCRGMVRTDRMWEGVENATPAGVPRRPHEGDLYVLDSSWLLPCRLNLKELARTCLGLPIPFKYQKYKRGKGRGTLPRGWFLLFLLKSVFLYRSLD